MNPSNATIEIEMDGEGNNSISLSRDIEDTELHELFKEAPAILLGMVMMERCRDLIQMSYVELDKELKEIRKR